MKSLPIRSPNTMIGTAINSVTTPTSSGCLRHRSNAGAYHCFTFRSSATSSPLPARDGFRATAAAIGTSVNARISAAAIAAITAAAKG